MERKKYLKPRIDVVEIEMESLLETVSSEPGDENGYEDGGTGEDLAKMKWTLWDEE